MPAFAFSNLLFAIPALLCLVSAWLACRASRAVGRRAGAWRLEGMGALAGTGCSLLAVVTSVSGDGATAGLYAGTAATVLLAAAAGAFALDARRSARALDAVEPLVILGVVTSVVIDVVIVPGFTHGDPLLTLVVLVDLLALACIGLATTGTLPRNAKVALCAAATLVLLGDAEASAEAAGTIAPHAGLAGLLWGFAAIAIVVAAFVELRHARRPRLNAPVVRHPAVRTWGRVLLPLGAVAVFPFAVAVHAVLEGAADRLTVGYYAGWAAVTTIVAFTRQAHLLVENRRAVERERALRAEAQRRAGEMEALTGLATALTEVVDEPAILELGLAALCRAGGTGTGAIHLDGDSEPALACSDAASGPVEAARLPLAGRTGPLGVVTLARPAAAGPFGEELGVLRLLAGQLALGLQHAREHRASLESALRDPLTGLYNSRFFFEAFDKEVSRHARYGTSAALIVLDVDDFRPVNEALGHEAADDLLRRVAQVIEAHIRPSDSLARVGGEEFAILLPETGQMDALLAAERVRTAISRQELVPGMQLTVSGGIAAMPHDGTTREELTRRADAAMRWAKRNGKNLCAVAREMEAEASPEIAEGMLAHLHAVVAGIDSAHLHTRDHSENVAAYAVAIAQELGLDHERIVRLRRAAFLHDIGKIAVPDAVLSKPDKLTDEEYEAIKVHPVVGGHMLQHAGLHAEAAWVRHHHERFDGGGYPDGIKGEALELEARIIFVADSFEAMTSDRPYSRGRDACEAAQELRRCAGTQFDPRVVDAMCALLAEDRLDVLALRDPIA